MSVISSRAKSTAQDTITSVMTQGGHPAGAAKITVIVCKSQSCSILFFNRSKIECTASATIAGDLPTTPANVFTRANPTFTQPASTVMSSISCTALFAGFAISFLCLPVRCCRAKRVAPEGVKSIGRGSGEKKGTTGDVAEICGFRSDERELKKGDVLIRVSP